MNEYKAIIFDLDGVICSTDRYHYLAWKQIADKLEIPFDENDNNRLRGVGRMESLEIILEKYDAEISEQRKEELAGQKNAAYRQLLQRMTHEDLTDEVGRTLDTLRARGKKLAIGSSSKNAKLILKQIGLENYFDVISDGTNIQFSKPHPEVFLKAAEGLELDPVECLVVEDALSGIEAAHAGGFCSAGIGDAAKSGMATYSLQTFEDLLAIVK